jgi:hypothetical protein
VLDSAAWQVIKIPSTGARSRIGLDKQTLHGLYQRKRDERAGRQKRRNTNIAQGETEERHVSCT